MLSENQEASPAQEEIQGQNDQTEVQSSTQNDALSKEQAYAKSLRHRAQAAEKELQNLKQNAKDKADKDLADQGKYKEMYEGLKKESDAWKANSDEYNEFKKSEKQVLLDQLPEDDRAIFKDLGLKQLKAVVNKTQSKSNSPKVIHGEVNNQLNLDKPYGDMSEAERRALYDEASKG